MIEAPLLLRLQNFEERHDSIMTYAFTVFVSIQKQFYCELANGMAIYPQVVLCGKHWIKGRYDTSDTVMLHDFQNGWGSEALNHRIRFKLKSLATIIKWKLLDSKTYKI